MSRKIDVIAYSGYRGEESPRAFYIGDERIDVVAVERTWIEENKEDKVRRRYFRVKGSDSHIHTIYYEEQTDQWFLV
jgi:hypothetical protein